MHKGTHHSSQACCFGNRSQKGASNQQVKVQWVTLQWCVGGEKSARKNDVINFSQSTLLQVRNATTSFFRDQFVNTSLGITKLAWNSKEHPRDFYDQHEVYKALYSLQCRERVLVLCKLSVNGNYRTARVLNKRS